MMAEQVWQGGKGGGGVLPSSSSLQRPSYKHHEHVHMHRARPDARTLWYIPHNSTTSSTAWKIGGLPASPTRVDQSNAVSCTSNTCYRQRPSFSRTATFGAL